MELSPEHLRVLKELALMGGIGDFVAITSGDLARRCSISQQSASEKILALAGRGFIQRRMAGRKQHIAVTPEGAGFLWNEHSDYMRLFEPGRPFTISGTVTTGLGEGRYYMALPGYVKQFRRMLGFRPFPGTLNLKLSADNQYKLRVMEEREGIEIVEFVSGGRTFGGAKCFRAAIRELKCAVIIPHRTHHRAIVEIISPDNLRARLDVGDGDAVVVEVEA